MFLHDEGNQSDNNCNYLHGKNNNSICNQRFCTHFTHVITDKLLAPSQSDSSNFAQHVINTEMGFTPKKDCDWSKLAFGDSPRSEELPGYV